MSPEMPFTRLSTGYRPLLYLPRQEKPQCGGGSAAAVIRVSWGGSSVVVASVYNPGHRGSAVCRRRPHGTPISARTASARMRNRPLDTTGFTSRYCQLPGCVSLSRPVDIWLCSFTPGRRGRYRRPPAAAGRPQRLATISDRSRWCASSPRCRSSFISSSMNAS